MSTALYRRYRPETFDEVIGQEHVTDPLKAAIERGRINHAYLFSGPRGCGKTTSARILARCLNCEKGPTPVPCGECPSCRDLANGGPGSLDVVEIDAASHNGVDDARDLRERAIYAPARDRFKVFILDEAHMVTSQGFNALLKIVEEPPPHIKFIFATTEPEKVIGTIRSRTHHYPFRLVPPEALGNYLDELCRRENVQVAKGVLPLVVRAGGGSVRDTLSVLDQLIAGSGPNGVDYARAIALLGYTPDSLLSDIVDAFSAGDGAGVYRAVERVIESGQDPRRFVEDLLERMRDLIVIHAAPEAAQAFLPEVPPDRLERLTLQARGFGQAELSRAADLLNQGLTEMSGATSPRLQLELICARILLPASGRSRDAVLSRVERMERRIGMSATGVTAVPVAAPASSTPTEGTGTPAGGTGTAAGSASGGGPVSAQGPSKPQQPTGQDPAAQQPTARPESPAAQGPDTSWPSRSEGGPSSDDIDELTAMAAAAESMLQEPHEQTPPPRQERQGQSQQQPSPAQQQEQPQSPTPPLQEQQSPPPRQPNQGQSQRMGEQPSSPAVPERSNRPQGMPQHGQDDRGQSEQQRSQAAPHQQDTRRAASQATGQESPQPAGPAGPTGPAGVDSSGPAGPGGGFGGEIEAIRRAWPSILAAVEKRSRLTRAIIAANAIPQTFADGVLYLGFNNAGSVQGFQQRDHAAKLSSAINDVLGIQARIDVGDVGRLPGNSGHGDAGTVSAAPGGSTGSPAEDFTGNHGPGTNPRRPSPQEVAAVVGPREVDKPQVDHEKFWETSDSAQGPWSSDDEEGEPSGEPDDRPADAETSPGAFAPAHFAPAPAQPETVSPGIAAGERMGHGLDRAGDGDDSEFAPAGDSGGAAPAGAGDVSVATPAGDDSGPVVDDSEPDILVPDLSDDDFAMPSVAASETSPASDNRGGPTDRGTGGPDADAESPPEYVQPRWEEPVWHDGPQSPGDPTSAGAGAVEVGALVVPPPEDDDLDYLGTHGDPDVDGNDGHRPEAGYASGSASTAAPGSRPHSSPTGPGKPFTSRFAAIAQRYGAAPPEDPAPSYGNDHGSPAAGAAADVTRAGSHDDEYDPETDLDVTDAPQIGVAVIARVLGGEIIDEREV